MKNISEKTRTLLVELAAHSYDTPIRKLYKAFMSGELQVVDSKTGKPLNPSDYDPCEFESVRFGDSQEKMGEYFNTLPPRKSQDRESDTCGICYLLHRANQLRNELFVIDKQLTETYGISLSDGVVLWENKSPASHTLRQGDNKIGRFYSRSRMQPSGKGNVSPTHQETPEYSCCRDVMDLL